MKITSPSSTKLGTVGSIIVSAVDFETAQNVIVRFARHNQRFAVSNIRVISNGVSSVSNGATLAVKEITEATYTAASSTLTSNNTNVSNNATVTIDSKVYTFKTALTPTEGEVLIGADADASLLNLIRAINHTGTPDTDYKCAAAHPTVSAAASVTSHAFAITALTAGADGNAIATTETSATLSFTGSTLAGGLDYTIGATLSSSAQLASSDKEGLVQPLTLISTQEVVEGERALVFQITTGSTASADLKDIVIEYITL